MNRKSAVLPTKWKNIFAEMREGRLQLQPETNDLLFEAVDTD